MAPAAATAVLPSRAMGRLDPATRNWPLLAALVTAITLGAAFAVHGHGCDVPGLSGLSGLETRTIDWRFRARGPRPITDDRIVVVGLDDETRRAAPDVFQTRRGWGRLLDALGATEPKAIALDLFFASREVLLPEPLAAQVVAAYDAVAADPAPTPTVVVARDALAQVVEMLRGDEVLAAAVARAKVVVLGAMFRLIEREADRPTEPPRGRPGLEKAEVGESVGGAPTAPSAFAAVSSQPAIAAGALAAGAVNHYRDPDGVARRMPLVIELGGRHYTALALTLAGLVEAAPTRFYAARREVRLGARALPVTAHLNYFGKPFPRISAAAVLDGRAGKAELGGKVVIVGLTHAAYDKVPTPYDPLADGVELHATLLHNLLHDELLTDGGPALRLGALVCFAALAVVLQLRRVRRRMSLPLVIAVVALALWYALAQLLFARGIVVELVAPALMFAAAMLAATIATLSTEGREKAALRGAFAQYVSKSLVERILADPKAARLGGERRELTVLFSDIRGFSRIAESLPPERLADFLNEYLTPMTEIVLERDGTLDKYIGDAVMAIWNAPVEIPDHPTRACAAALAMQDALGPLNARWRARGLPAVQIGIGLNSGPMSVGNMGSESRFDYTVLGDAVNLAARLEALTKEYGVDILVGEDTAAGAKGFVFREMDHVRLKGKDRPARIFELCGRPGGAGVPTPDDLATWDRALAAYRRRAFADAGVQFLAIAAADPDDGAARVFAARARDLAEAPPGDDWDGVYEQRSK